MRTAKVNLMKTYHIFALLVAFLFCTSCDETKTKVATVGDVSFARSTFESLARGDASVANKIDWPVFTSMGNNAGAAYSLLPSGVEKERFVSNFITQFAASFREGGGSVDQFTNWRVVTHDSQSTEVAAESPGGILTIIVSERNNDEKVSSINIVK